MHHRSRGITLIELLVSIGVIALLIGILAPAVGKSLNRSRELASAVNLRSIGQLFEIYSSNARGLYPAPVSGVLYPTHAPGAAKTIAHWGAVDEWPFLFASSHPWWEYERLYLAPGAERELSGPVVVIPRPSFEYSASFLGHPSIWSGHSIGTHEWPGLERSVTQSMVRYPAGKVLMWDIEMPYLRRPLERDDLGNLRERTPMLFADQHIANHIPAEAVPGVANFAPFASRPHHSIHNTPNGVHGRDY